jgi:hypothetical protein
VITLRNLKVIALGPSKVDGRTMESSDEYRPRIVDAELADALRRLGAVLVNGPKYVGKTSTALRQAGSSVRSDDRQDRRTQEAPAVDPSILFQETTPVLLDEWQEFLDLAPDALDELFAVDRAAWHYEAELTAAYFAKLGGAPARVQAQLDALRRRLEP